MRSAIGDENGSSSAGYAAVFGRCDFGSERSQFAKTSPLSTIGAGCVKKTLCELLVEHGGAAAGRLDERVAVAVRDGCGRRGEQGRERPEDEVDLVLRDEVLVVRRRLRRAAGVVLDDQLHLPAQDAALRVDGLRPQLVALLANLPGSEKSPESDSEMPILIGPACGAAAPVPVVAATAAIAARVAQPAMTARRMDVRLTTEPPCRTGRREVRRRAAQDRLGVSSSDDQTRGRVKQIVTADASRGPRNPLRAWFPGHLALAFEMPGAYRPASRVVCLSDRDRERSGGDGHELSAGRASKSLRADRRSAARANRPRAA